MRGTQRRAGQLVGTVQRAGQEEEEEEAVLETRTVKHDRHLRLELSVKTDHYYYTYIL